MKMNLSAMFQSRKWCLAIACAILLPRVITLFVPLLAIDEGIYAVFAQEILHGALPYRDLVDYKAPLIFYFYALGFFLGGDYNMVLVHLLHILVVAALCMTLFQIGRGLGNERGGYLAALFYAIFSATWVSKQVLATNGEALMVLPLALGALFLFKADHQLEKQGKIPWHLDFLAAVALGSAFMIKYTAGINLAVTLLYLLFLRPYWFKDQETLKRAMVRCLTYCIGFILPLLLVVFYFWQKGILWDLYFWGFYYNKTYISLGNQYLSWDYFLIKLVLRTALFATGSILIWVLGGKKALGSLRLWFQNRKRRKPPENIHILFTTLWFFFSFIPVSLGGRFFYHYYIQLIPPLCLLAALVAENLWEKKKVRGVIISCCLIPMAIFMGESTSKLWQKKPNYEVLGNYLKENSNPPDRIFIWGYLPRAFVIAQRRPASRFIFSQFLTGSSPKTHGMDFDPQKPEARPNALKRVMLEFTYKDPPLQDYDTSEGVVPEAWPMFFEDMKKNEPLYFVDTSPANIARYGKYPLERFPKLKEFVEENYEQETIIEKMTVYRRKK